MTAPFHRATVRLANQLGLHARAAAKVVKLTARRPCDVFLLSDGQRVNGKSIMGVLMLALAKGMAVTIEVSGPEAEICLAELVALFNSGFGELKPEGG